ncbi:MAG: ATP-binding protein [Formivibrio sp.]|nr:ATP-binding protein [Formivibrio sp.]
MPPKSETKAPTLAANAIHLFVGASKSGKSHLLHYMLMNTLMARKLKFGVVFCSTKFNNAYDWIQDKYVYDNLGPEGLNAYLSALKAIAKSGKPIPPNFIVVDDCLVGAAQSSRWWLSFLSKARHYTTLIVTTQHVNKAAEFLRSQADYVYIFRQFTMPAIETSFESFGALLSTKKAWQKFIDDHTTAAHQCVVYDKNSPLVLTDRYHTMIAPAKLKDIKFVFDSQPS